MYGCKRAVFVFANVHRTIIYQVKNKKYTHTYIYSIIKGAIDIIHKIHQNNEKNYTNALINLGLLPNLGIQQYRLV